MGIFNRFKKDKPFPPPQNDRPAAVSLPTPASAQPVAAKTGQAATAFGKGASDVVIKPLISEKAATLTGANQYVFIVRKGANRLQVRTAIKRMYNVSPVSVNILNVKGKEMRFGRRNGTRSDWKKAIVTLPKGETINVYEGV